MKKKQSIVIIDYGMGNIRSIIRKINQTGNEGIVTAELHKIKNADKLILPGVGHFMNGMSKLINRDLVDLLTERVFVNKTPILGICLGMQLFTRHSEEGDSGGLGWIDAVTVKFRLYDIRHKVPHIGWNSLEKKKDSPILKGLADYNSYYFVHSYHIECNDPADIISTTWYGYEFVSAIQKGNIFGTQFHPEKSQEAGGKMLINFLNI